MMLDVIGHDECLGPVQRRDDGLNLLRDLEPVAAVLDHLDDPRETAIRTPSHAEGG